jgi:alpha-galactosidase
MISRRKLLELGVVSPFVAALSHVTQAQGLLSRAASSVVPLVDGVDVSQVKVERRWNGSICQSQIKNQGREGVRLKEIVLFDLKLPFPATTKLYGEGFQMLSQTGGTLGQPADLGNYTDAKHYKLPAPPNTKVLYGMMMLSPSQRDHHLFAFTSCYRFAGQFYLNYPSLKVVLDIEGRELRPGEEWKLESFTYQSGNDREQLLDQLAKQLVVNHQRLESAAPPTGWCSWYCFGPRVTAQQVLDNLDFIAKHTPGLRYVQIDDGYQPAMGDWLETGAAFGGNVQGVLKEIRARGFEPAIWVAPFVAEEKSTLFQSRPDWFVKDADGAPLRSDRVTFGGWRRGPWYVLDGTHPEVWQYFKTVFRKLERAWGCTYFKLDANFWGAIHGGHFHDKRATRVEAYREGMRAIVHAVGNSFILGCNHPIWPSLGLIHGSRSSNDIKRTWERIKTTARQNLSRNWQNGRLWWNDSDAIVLTGDLPDNEFQFHATAIYASGGMLLSGDDLTKISAEKLAMLRKLQPPTGVAARFEDDSFRVGKVLLGTREVLTVLNWDDTPQDVLIRLHRRCRMMDFWSEADLGIHSETFEIKNMPARSGRLLICVYP